MKSYPLLFKVYSTLFSLLFTASTIRGMTAPPGAKSFCETGSQQSPINVEVPSCKTKEFSPIALKDDLLFTNEIQFENNCKTAEITFVNKALEPKVGGGPLGNDTYIINSIHFHWGTKKTEGCEHRISGKSFPMETHVVLRKSTFKDLQSALDGHGVAVLGFLYTNAPEPNPNLTQMLDAIKKIKEPHTKANAPGQVMSYLKEFVPGGFYSYTGSLTTGTCPEGILWILYKKNIPISVPQLDLFHDIKDETGKEDENWREVKPLNNREVCQSSF